MKRYVKLGMDVIQKRCTVYVYGSFYDLAEIFLDHLFFVDIRHKTTKDN